MMFECERLGSRDDEGLESVGVRWTEARAFTEQAIYKCGEATAMLGVLATLFGLGFGLSGSVPILMIGAGLPLFLAAYVIVRASVHVPGRERELSFWRDGLIYAPLGLGPWPRGWTQSRFDHTDIRSIEAEQLVQKKKDDDSPHTHGVRIFFHGGQVSHVAKDLEPDQAHMLAVALTHALVELRQSLALRGRVRKTREQDYVID